MRTLVIAAEYPWPVNSGSRMRLENTLRALCECGETDLFSVVSASRSDFELPPHGLGVRRIGTVRIPEAQRRLGWARAAVSAHTPFEMPVLERRRVTAALSASADATYDLVWCFRVRAWVLAGEPAYARTVVDLDDLEDQKIRAQIAFTRTGRGENGGGWRAGLGTAWLERDARRWARLHGRIARRSAATVVCSELDARRAALEGVRVVPNGYDLPEHPVGRTEPGSPPTVLFHGTLRYPPNADGARWLATEVAPALRSLVPEARLRLVGTPGAGLEALHDPPAVTVVGQVPDITAELGRADVVAVPLRFASGTRVKVLEAFAHRVPVVSTTVGAEGLEVEDGSHLLLADDAGSLARALARAIGDRSLRARMVGAAQDLLAKRYLSSTMREEVVSVAREVTAR